MSEPGFGGFKDFEDRQCYVKSKKAKAKIVL